MDDKHNCSRHEAPPATSDLSADWSQGEAGVMPSVSRLASSEVGEAQNSSLRSAAYEPIDREEEVVQVPEALLFSSVKWVSSNLPHRFCPRSKRRLEPKADPTWCPGSKS